MERCEPRSRQKNHTVLMSSLWEYNKPRKSPTYKRSLMRSCRGDKKCCCSITVEELTISNTTTQRMHVGCRAISTYTEFRERRETTRTTSTFGDQEYEPRSYRAVKLKAGDMEKRKRRKSGPLKSSLKRMVILFRL